MTVEPVSAPPVAVAVAVALPVSATPVASTSEGLSTAEEVWAAATAAKAARMKVARILTFEVDPLIKFLTVNRVWR